MPRGDNNRRLSDADRAEVVRRYTTQLQDGTWEGSNTIAPDFSVHQNTIIYVLRRAGVTIRSAKEAHAYGKRCGPIKHIEQLGEPPLCACGCGMPTHWVRSKYKWSKYANDACWHKPKAYKNREWLCKQYLEHRRSVPDIASECGVYASTVIRTMNKFGIALRDASTSHKGRQSGARNPAWKGGTTPERQRLYKTNEWKALLKNVYARDGYTCQRCKQGTSGGASMRSSVAHHIKSFSDYPELRMDMANLVTLCRKCHLWVHSKANTAHEFLS